MSGSPQLELLNDWIEAQLDGELTSEQHAQLEILLRRDVAARRAYIELMHQHATTRRLLGTAPVVEANIGIASVSEEGETSSNSLTPRKMPSRLSRAANFLTRPTPLSLTIAASVMIALLTGLYFVTAPIYRAIVHDNHEEVRPSYELVAQVTDVHDVVWADSELSAFKRAHLVKGRELRLQSGLVEVTFNDGARAVIEGPASIRVETSNSALLQRGKLYAFVPDQATGFAIQTPQAAITDLGTEFGVDVDRNGGVDVITFLGQVKVEVASDVGTSSVTFVSAGQSVRVERGEDGRVQAARQPVPARAIFASQLPKKSVINVDIQPSGNAIYAGRGAYAGQGTEWNDVSALGKPSRPLNTSAGDSTPATLEIQGGSLHRTVVGNSGHGLTDDYVYVSNAEGPRTEGRFVIRGLIPAETYQLFLYGTAGEARGRQDQIGEGATEGTLFTVDGVTKSTTGLRQSDPHFRQGKDYVSFRVEADPSGTITGSWTNNPQSNAPLNNNPFGIFNGLQIAGEFVEEAGKSPLE